MGILKSPIVQVFVAAGVAYLLYQHFKSKEATTPATTTQS